MPNRILRADILTSEPVCSLDWASEVFYRRLHSVVDDYGRYEAGIQLLRSKCYPLQTDDVRVADITRWMAACQKAGLIVLYEVAGKRYLEVAKFGQQRRTDSKFPPPPAIDINCQQVQADAHLGVFGVGVVSEVDKPAAQTVFVLPDWIPGEVWAAYLETRKAKKAKSTVYALNLVVKTLEQIRDAGHDPIDALKSSIKGGWTDVYAPKQQGFIKPAPNATVPGKSERDPELTRLDIERARAVPMPAAVREAMAKLKQGASA